MELKSLLEHMNEALAATGSGYQSVEDFISDGPESQKFIDYLMDQNTTEYFPGKKSLIYHYSQERARHIAVTFLVGMVFSEFCGFYKSLPGVLNCRHLDEDQKAALAQRIWLITSLSHDNGYRLTDKLADKNLVLENAFPRFLLTDTYADPNLKSVENFSHNYPQVLAHNYDQILNYNKYVQKYHKKWKSLTEVNDHGVLGGVEKFNDLTRSMCKMNPADRDRELPLLKACCLTVAQHNIFTSYDDEYDVYYHSCHLDHLLSTSNFRITDKTPLLLFLCLVDTIECMKRFSKGATKGKYLEAPTILRKIMLHVDADKIVLDFTALKEHIDSKEKDVKDEEKELGPIYKKYLATLTDFQKWTIFKGVSNPANGNIITITLK